MGKVMTFEFDGHDSGSLLRLSFGKLIQLALARVDRPGGRQLFHKGRVLFAADSRNIADPDMGLPRLADVPIKLQYASENRRAVSSVKKKK